MIDSQTSADAALFDRLAEEFSAGLRAGKHPTAEEYAARFPGLAEVILDRFPALVAIEAIGAKAQRDPEWIGKFRVVRRLGAGGMGVVYEAVHEALRCRVAVKVLPAGCPPSYLERFRREAHAASRLRHDHIVPVYDFGEAEGEPYLVMQFIEGQSLDAILCDLRTEPKGPCATAPDLGVASTEHDGAAPLATRSNGRAGLADGLHSRRAATWAEQAALALAYAHRQGVVHRDVKPANLLIDGEDRLWVADFGLAKTGDSESLTRTGDLVGTLRYMAPESLRGQGDERSDIYSLGATLYEMLALRPAFDEGDRLALIDRIRHEAPIPIRRVDPEIPRDLETICLRAMAREPGDRYDSALELAADLRRFLDDRPVLARRSSSAEDLWRWARRNRALASLAALVAILLVLVAASSTLAALAMKRSRDAALGLTAQSQRAERERSRQLALSYLDQARTLRLSDRPGRRFGSLASIARARELVRHSGLPGSFVSDLRDQAIAALALSDVEPPPEGPGTDPGPIYCIAAGSWGYVESNPAGGMSVRRIVDGSLVARLASAPHESRVRMSSDGEIIAVLSENGTLRAWDIGRDPSSPAWDDPANASACDVRGDGGELAIGLVDGTVRLMDPTGQAPVRALTGPGRPADVAYAPDGRSLAVASGSVVVIFDVASGGRIAESAEESGVFSVGWHPGGRALAIACNDGTVHVRTVPSGKTQHRLPARSGGSWASYTRDGELLLTQGWDSTLRLWDVRSGALALVAYRTDGLRLDRDGRLWARAGRGGLRRLEVAPAKAYRVAERAGAQTVPRQIGVHPQGRLLVAACDDHAIFWDMTTGYRRTRLLAPIASLAFDEAGTLFTRNGERTDRWAISAGSALKGSLAITNTGHLPAPTTSGAAWIAVRRDGSRYAVRADGQVVIVARDGTETTIGPQRDVRHGDFSPDGQWLVAASWNGGDGVRVYDASTGRLAIVLAGGRLGYASFSPDGRLLAASVEGTPQRLYRVGTWKPVADVPGRFATFSGDGRLMATAEADGTIILLTPETGRALARLEPPELGRVHDLALAPEGSRLAVADSTGRVAIWDLTELRRELDALGLGDGFPGGQSRTD